MLSIFAFNFNLRRYTVAVVLGLLAQLGAPPGGRCSTGADSWARGPAAAGSGAVEAGSAAAPTPYDGGGGSGGTSQAVLEALQADGWLWFVAGLTLVHFSPQLEPFLTQNIPGIPTNIPQHLLTTA